MANSGFSNWYAYRRASEILPPLSTAPRMFRGYRIPRPAVELVGEAPPGLICWGTVGSLPSPIPLPTIGFNVVGEEWKEWGRKSEDVRIENPDDPSQYIMDRRPTQVDFNKAEHGAKAGSNTATEVPPGMSNYANTDPFVSSDGQKTSKVRVHYVTQTAPTVTPLP